MHVEPCARLTRSLPLTGSEIELIVLSGLTCLDEIFAAADSTQRQNRTAVATGVKRAEDS